MASRNDYSTPQDLFERIDDHFHFGLDVCATRENSKCKRYCDILLNGLVNPWANRSYNGSNRTVWCNPPYSNDKGRPCVGQWVQKAIDETANGVTTVMLLVNDPSTKWHALMREYAIRIRHLTGPRVRFELDGEPVGTPSFTCDVVVIAPLQWGTLRGPVVDYWDWRNKPWEAQA